MGGPYNIPRNYKGENKILFIFSTKSFLYTAIGGFIGIFIYKILQYLGISKIGLIFIVIFAFLGYIIGTLKIPENNTIGILKKIGGEPIDQIIVRWIKFKRKKNKIYVYMDKKEVKTNVK